MKRALALSLQFLALWAFWMALVAKADRWELLVGGVCAVVATFAFAAVAQTRLAHVGRHLRAFLSVWRVAPLAVTDTWNVLVVLARHLFTGHKAPSMLKSVKYACTADDDEDALDRALAIAYTTMTPNFVVIDIDKDRGELHYHLIADSDVPEMTIDLGARP